jgi:bilirubin oxidase
MPVPDTLSGQAILLTMHPDSVSLLPGKKTATLAFNQNHILGPTLIFEKGKPVNLSVTNQIGDTTTVHWHGLHVPAKDDGGPHTMIMDGDTWSPSFTVQNQAATYWYHPHFMGKTAEHVIKGAAGLIIVRDAEERALNLPRTYGIDDIPVLLRCLQLDSNNQILPRGMQDSTLLVNGVNNAEFDLPAQVVRMRLLNGSGERTFNIGFTGSQQFYVIANDGGLLSAPVAVTRIRLAPGERVEVLIDLKNMSGQSIHLMSYGSELPIGVQGGPTMPMPPGSPPMDSPLNGVDYDILKLNITAQTTNPVTTIPNSLVPVVPFNMSDVNTTRGIVFNADSLMVMDGPFYFNGLSYDMERIDYRIPINHTEIWTLTDSTMVAHPFHVHDVQFQVLDRDGQKPLPEEQGWKDVVLVQPYETVRIMMKFTNFADSMIPYMFHCHILMHEDDGMMGQFVVMPEGWTGLRNISEDETMSLYPNPTNGMLSIKIDGFEQNKPMDIKVTDALGKIILKKNSAGPEINIDLSEQPMGMYMIQCQSGEKRITQKLIRN